MARQKTIIEKTTGIECDSTHELAFIWWMLELKQAGYILAFKRSETLSIIDKTEYNLPNGKSRVLTNSLKYTPDFVIIFSKSARGKFFNFRDISGNDTDNDKTLSIASIKRNKNGDYIAYIDIKNPYDKGGVKTLFSVKQKIVMLVKKIYVDDVDIQHVFFNTFTPNRYLLSDLGKKKRSIRFKTRTLKEYING